MNIKGLVLLGVIFGVILVFTGCHRSADHFDDAPPEHELQDLRVEACEALCATTDECQPNRFEGMDPPLCFDRCMTLLPRLYQENQCGSREIQWMNCVGDLTCDQFYTWDTAMDHGDYYGGKCASEFGRATKCHEDEPFDLDEDNSHYP